MARPVTLFTGQWADLPIAQLAPLAKEMGYDGLELCTWGDHFEVRRALEDDRYVRGRLDLLERSGLRCYAIGAHLVGQGPGSGSRPGGNAVPDRDGLHTGLPLHGRRQHPGHQTVQEPGLRRRANSPILHQGAGVNRPGA